jgi:hypothetical protein
VTIATGRYCRLRPVAPPDLPNLFNLLMQPDHSFAWRYRGTTPSFQEFSNEFFTDVLIAACVCPIDADDIVGFVALYRSDLRNGFAYATVCVPAKRQAYLAPDAMVTLAKYTFDEWPIRKIYLERPAFVGGFSRALSRYGTHEGTLTDHVFRGGDYHDLHIYSLSPKQVETAFERLHRRSSAK